MEEVKAVETKVEEAPKKRAYKRKNTVVTKGAKRGAKKVVDVAEKALAKAPKKPAQKFEFARTVFEYQKMQFTEESANKKVLEYLEKHPYIHASRIETFINFDERKIFFTVDGYSNPDFSLDL